MTFQEIMRRTSLKARTLRIQQLLMHHSVETIQNQRIVEYWDWITRDMVKANRDKIFLFGDNLLRKGMAGQAKEMRHEWNAIGIPTKKKPDNHPNSFFTDDEFFSNCNHIDMALAEIPSQLTVIIPSAGIGTGLAQLDVKAPRTFEYLQKRLANLS